MKGIERTISFRMLRVQKKIDNDPFPQTHVDTLKSMIQTRGFFYSENSIEKAIQKGKGKTSYAVQYKRKDTTLDVLFVQQKTEKKSIRNYTSALKNNDQLVVIFLSNNYEPSRVFDNEDDRVCIFNADEFAQNILLHKWVPKHQKIDKKELDYITHIYQLPALESLPLISHKDPVVKFNGWRCGDVIRITRIPVLCPRSLAPSKNMGSGCGTYCSYRYVTKISEFL